MKIIKYSLVFLFLSPLHAEINETILIKNATAMTAMKSGTLQNTDILIVDGLIAKIGQNLNFENAIVIDATNHFVTPGLIAPHSMIGLQEIELEAETRDDSTDYFSSGFSIVDAYNPSSALIPHNRTGGITTAIVTPSSGHHIFSGMASVFKLDGKLTEESIGQDIAMVMSFGGSEDSRASQMLLIKDGFIKAKNYHKSRTQIMRGGYFDFGYYTPRDLEAILRVVSKEIPLIVRTDRARDILRMIAFSNSHEIDIILAGAKEAWRIADKIALESIPVILDPMDNIPSSFDSIAARMDNASILNNAGVKILITSQSTHNSYLSRQGAGNAVAYGLSEEDALKALTINVASVFGLDERIGTLEVGKDADLLIWDGHPLEVSSFTKKIYIDGKEISTVTRSQRLRDRYLKKLGLD
jgi:imidazolonepropionase-like amidohydrolase